MCEPAGRAPPTLKRFQTTLSHRLDHVNGQCFRQPLLGKESLDIRLHPPVSMSTQPLATLSRPPIRASRPRDPAVLGRDPARSVPDHRLSPSQRAQLQARTGDVAMSHAHRPFLVLLASAVAALPLVGAPAPAAAATLNLTQYVNPFIGTDDSNSPNPVGGGAGGSTVPGRGRAVRHGAVQPGHARPRRRRATAISDRTSRSSASPTSTAPAAPTTRTSASCRSPAPSAPRPGTGWTSYPRPTRRPTRARRPGYYKTGSTSTATRRRAVARPRAPASLRLTYPATTTARVLVNTSRSATGNRSGIDHHQRQPGHRQRHRAAASAARRKTYQIFFAIAVRPGARAASAPGTAAPSQHGLDQHQRHQHRRLRHLRHHRQRRRSA